MAPFTYQIVQGGATGENQVLCPSGEIATGGGWDTGSSVQDAFIFVEDSTSLLGGVGGTTPVGWQVIIFNDDEVSIAFRVCAVCTKGGV